MTFSLWHSSPTMSLPKLGIASYELGISYVMTYDNLQPGAHQTKFPFAKFSGRDISMLLFGLLCSLSYYKMDQNYQLICHKVNKDTKISDKNDSKTKKLRHKILRRKRLIHKQPGVDIWNHVSTQNHIQNRVHNSPYENCIFSSRSCTLSKFQCSSKFCCNGDAPNNIEFYPRLTIGICPLRHHGLSRKPHSWRPQGQFLPRRQWLHWTLRSQIRLWELWRSRHYSGMQGYLPCQYRSS